MSTMGYFFAKWYNLFLDQLRFYIFYAFTKVFDFYVMRTNDSVNAALNLFTSDQWESCKYS